MPNYVLYLLLLLISLSILLTIMIRKRQFGVLVLFLSFSGMVYVAEYFVFVVWNSYEYYPEVLSKRYYDNVLGAVVSNLFIIPALGTLVAIYRPRYYWSILFAVALVGVEWLFVDRGIYHSHWWRKEYTLFVLLFYFFLTGFWLRQLEKGLNVFRYITLWLQTWAMVGTVMYTMSVIGIRYYQIGFYTDLQHGDIFTASLMGMLKSAIFSLFVIRFNKVRWRLLAPLLVFGIDLPLAYYGVLIIKWPFWLYTLLYLLLAALLLWWNSYAYRYIRSLKQ